MRWPDFLVAAACIAACSACSGIRSTDKIAGAGGGGSADTGAGAGAGMTGTPIGDSGVCFGDPADPCGVCRCTNCGALTAACATDTACAAAESDFYGCASRAQDPASITQCRDTANAASAKAGPYLDCLIAACAGICI
jgi:hypothetical protein